MHSSRASHAPTGFSSLKFLNLPALDLAPAGLRSRPPNSGRCASRIGAASRPNGSKLPRHRKRPRHK
ncbi:hypothetical protein EI534_12830 [Pseudomonas frederiksbergensis]|nr:hypothetical protein [Pseudomonas frederiksbergensis]